MERLFEIVGGAAQPIRSSDDLARIVFNSRNDVSETPERGIAAVLQMLQQHI